MKKRLRKPLLSLTGISSNGSPIGTRSNNGRFLKLCPFWAGTLDGTDQPIDSFARARIWVTRNQKGRRNLDSNDWACLVAAVVPDFADEADRRHDEAAKKRAASGERTESGKFKPTLVNKLTNVEEPKPDKNANKAIAHAIASIAPGNTNRTYVDAVLKEAGYNAKENKIAKPERLAQIGSAPGQTKIADIQRQQRKQKQEEKMAKAVAAGQRDTRAGRHRANLSDPVTNTRSQNNSALRRALFPITGYSA